ncbi:MAG TPA: RNA polymerase sigma factor [Chitinophagaceae bacterium]|nr:RNA polymerase sigma factor [Chitinophagaceae bacterium]
MNEQDLIQGLIARNENAFRWLVNSYRDRVFSTTVHILQSTEEAEDAAQETFIKVYESISSFKGESSLSTWIYRIAVHKALDKLRRRKLRQRLRKWLPGWMPAEETSAGTSASNEFHHPGVLLDNKEKAAILFRAIRSLPEKQRAAFTLVKVQGMSYDEAAAVTGQSVKALESLITRAKINLQKQLASLHKHAIS